MTITIATSGAGISVVIRGDTSTMAMVSANSGYTTQGTLKTCGTCAKKIKRPSALTNPIMTERGINRVSRAMPSTPNTIWIRPANMIVGRM